MTRVTVTWEGDSYQRAVRAAAADGLAAAAFTLQGLAKEFLSEPGTPTSKTGRQALKRSQAALKAQRAAVSAYRAGGLVRFQRISRFRADAESGSRGAGARFIREISRQRLARNRLFLATRTTKAKKRRGLALLYEGLGGLVDPPGGRPRRRTGALRRSIRVKNDRENLRSVVGSGLVYARIHEVGGFILNGFGKGRKIYIPARPYLRAALNENITGLTSEFRRVMRGSLLARAQKRGIQ